jgi:hypothetical protein
MEIADEHVRQTFLQDIPSPKRTALQFISFEKVWRANQAP